MGEKLELVAWPPEVRDYAFQLWAYTFNRNATKVAERINDLHPNHDPEEVIEAYEADGREMKAVTIRVWAHQHKWMEKVQKQIREIAPGVHEQVVINIVAGSIEAADYLRQVVNDASIDTKYRVDAAKTILDRAGHLPYNRPADDTRPQGPTRDYSASIAGLSDDEIMAKLFGRTPDPLPLPDGEGPSSHSG